MHAAYFDTLFRFEGVEPEWPQEFAIITAFAPTGTIWSDERNEAADAALLTELKARQTWVSRLTGFAPSNDHAEPGWAVLLPFEVACDIGHTFQQDAIYYVLQDSLFVSHCDQRRKQIPVGGFRERLRTT